MFDLFACYFQSYCGEKKWTCVHCRRNRGDLCYVCRSVVYGRVFDWSHWCAVCVGLLCERDLHTGQSHLLLWHLPGDIIFLTLCTYYTYCVLTFAVYVMGEKSLTLSFTNVHNWVSFQTISMKLYDIVNKGFGHVLTNNDVILTINEQQSSYNFCLMSWVQTHPYPQRRNLAVHHGCTWKNMSVCAPMMYGQEYSLKCL